MKIAGHALRGATFSDCERYRYHLWRAWDASRPRLLWVMLNPSTADHTKVDPTVRRCLTRAEIWGFGSVEVANLFAYRSTAPEGLLEIADPVGPDNDHAIIEAAGRADRIVVAWGWQSKPGLPRLLEPRARTVAALLERDGHTMTACATTAAGWPRHPLYLRNELQPQPWRTP
jgi:hypothetical protein